MPAKNGFQLQDRDIAFLELTFQLGIATVDHFALHASRSYHLVYKRVAKLEAQRYLSRITKPPAKAMYQLGPDGAPILIEHGYAPETIARMRLRGNELKPLGRAHALHIANIHATLLKETRSRPETIDLWRQDPSLYDHVSLREGHGRETMLPVRPDAYFVIGRPADPEQIQFHFLLEADRGTMSHEAIAKKIMAYIAYHRDRHFVKKYPGMVSFRVLIVTETRARADRLRQGLSYLLPTARFQRAYRFIALEDLSLTAILPSSPSLRNGNADGKLV